jgi:hypothetical protein
LLEARLLESGLLAGTLGGFRGLDAQTRFTLGGETRFFDLALVIALRLDFCFFRFAPLTLRFFLRADASLFGTLYSVLFLLDAVLLDLTELA